MTMKSMSITSFALLSFLSTLPFQTTSFQQQYRQPSFIVRGKASSSSTTTLFEAMSSPSASASETQTTLNHIKGVEDISNKYSTYLLDMWGVMHNGSTTYDGVIQTIQNLVQTNKKLIILSNSSKRLSNSNKMLTKLGFTPDSDFCTIITSGDVSHRMLSGDGSLKCTTWDTLQKLLDANSNDSDNNNNKNVFVFGSGDNDEEYMTTCGWKLSSLEDANLIVARGTFTINDGSGNIIHKKDDEGLYFEILEQMLEQASKGNVHSNYKPIPMLVTNPDKVRPDKGLPPMPGAIGDAYEKYIHKLTGDDNDDDVDFDIQQIVKRIGKPYSEVYELALNECNDPSSVIMVGDALETDITGGKWSNIDTLWVVNDGIHSPYIQENGGDDKFEENVEVVLDDFNQKKGYMTEEEKIRPTYVAKHFQW